MKLVTILLILLVPVLNISLNTSVKSTANNAGTYIEAIRSHEILLPFLIGILLIGCMLGLYFTGINLSRAILTMGAISILGGSLFGVYYYNETLHIVEWLLFAAISGLLLYRLIFKF